MAPLAGPNLLKATQHRDAASGESLDLCERLSRIEPIEDFGLIPLKILGSAYAIEPGTGIELAIQP